MTRCRSVVLVVALMGCGPAAVPPEPPPAATSAVAPRAVEPRAAPSSAPSAAVVAAPRAPEPISGTLPTELEGKLVVHAVCNDKQCLVPGLYPSGAAAEGGAPVAIWSHDLPDKGSTLTFPRHSGVDLYGVVISGKVRVTALEKGARPADLERWGAFRAPGAGVSVAAQGGAARVVLAIAGDGAPIAETVAQLKDRKLSKRLAWSSRPAPIETIDLSAATDLAWGKGAMHARLGFEGPGRASFGLLFTSKDAPVAAHTHDTAWEILAPLTAEGTAKRGSSAGGTDLSEIPVTDGTVVAMPKGVLHEWVPGGTKPLLAVQMYLPPGPEQRFKKLAAEAAAVPAPATPK